MVYALDDLVFNPRTGSITDGEGRHSVLGKTAADALTSLVEAWPNALSREAFASQYGRQWNYGGRTLDTAVHEIRSVLGADRIQSSWGIGYVLQLAGKPSRIDLPRPQAAFRLVIDEHGGIIELGPQTFAAFCAKRYGYSDPGLVDFMMRNAGWAFIEMADREVTIILEPQRISSHALEAIRDFLFRGDWSVVRIQEGLSDQPTRYASRDDAVNALLEGELSSTMGGITNFQEIERPADAFAPIMPALDQAWRSGIRQWDPAFIAKIADIRVGDDRLYERMIIVVERGGELIFRFIGYKVMREVVDAQSLIGRPILRWPDSRYIGHIARQYRAAMHQDRPFLHEIQAVTQNRIVSYDRAILPGIDEDDARALLIISQRSDHGGLRQVTAAGDTNGPIRPALADRSRE